MEKLLYRCTGKDLLSMAVAAVALLPVLARAQGGLVNTEQEERNELGAGSSGWDVTLGAGAVGEPKYEGSKHYKLNPIPFVAIKYDDLVSLGIDGLRLNAIRSGGLRIGPMLSYSGGRVAGDDDLLQKLDDVPATLNGGAFVTYRLGHFEFLGQAQQAILHVHDGLFGKLGVTYQRRFGLFGKIAELDVGPQVEFANHSYENTWFGITPAESSRSGFREFSPSTGIKDVGVQSSLTYLYSPHILFRGVLNFKEMTGGAAESPLTTSRPQYFIGFGAGYRF